MSGMMDNEIGANSINKEDASDLGSILENERYQEAYSVAQEAKKTLAEARQAVAKVRAARGYYDPAGMKGSTKVPKERASPRASGQPMALASSVEA